MEIILNIIAAAGFGWWMTQNTILRKIFNKLNIEKYLCGQCISFFTFLVIVYFNWTILSIIGIAGVSAWLSNEMEKKTNL